MTLQAADSYPRPEAHELPDLGERETVDVLAPPAPFRLDVGTCIPPATTARRPTSASPSQMADDNASDDHGLRRVATRASTSGATSTPRAPSHVAWRPPAARNPSSALLPRGRTGLVRPGTALGRQRARRLRPHVRRVRHEPLRPPHDGHAHRGLERALRDRIDADGFDLRSDSGRADVEFHWMAVGRDEGHERRPDIS